MKLFRRNSVAKIEEYLQPCVLRSRAYRGRRCCSQEKRGATLKAKMQKHTTGGIPRWSPTLVLVARFSAYVWQSGRDAQFSLTYGRMYQFPGKSDYDTTLFIANWIATLLVITLDRSNGDLHDA
jgi:hypothetical protein